MSRRKYIEDDCILGLPEEIVAHIFSFLSIKEAVRTSILARRWKYNWKVSTHRLDFDIRVLYNKYCHYSTRCTSYVQWVDQVLNSIQDRPTIDALGICRPYLYILRDDVNRWVKYAIEKRVKRLELDFSTTNPCQELSYPFPLQFFDSSFMNSLKELALAYVSVSGEALEYILSECHVLDELSITDSPKLVDLRVSSLTLKCLKIMRCVYLKDLRVVDAVNLESFTYEGYSEISFFMGNVPKLMELNFGHYGPTSNDIVVKLPLYSPMLKTLIYHSGKYRAGASNFPNNFPEKFNNLKYLELKIAFGNLSILRFTSILKACPSLYKLKVEVVEAMDERELKEAAKEDPYECLEVVELVGSQVSPNIVEFIFHLVENAENLKKIIVDPRPTNRIVHPQTNLITEYELDKLIARNRAMEQIVSKLPPKIEFVLL